MQKVYQDASAEVLDILGHMSEEDQSRVSENFKEFLKENSTKGYEPNLDYSLSIYDMPLKEETKCLLAIIYRNYFASEDEKVEIQNIWIDNELIYEKEIEENSNKESSFTQNTSEQISNSEELTSDNKSNEVFDKIDEQQSQGLVILKESVFTKIINKIKSVLFKK